MSEITKLIPENDVFISAAAVSDFTVEKKSTDNSAKISSEEEFNTPPNTNTQDNKHG